jgi:arylsulfatase A-like enzyme
MVREGPWKPIRNHPWLGLAGEELYEPEADPWEMHDRVEDPACGDVRRRLAGLLDAFRRRQSARLPDEAPQPFPRGEYRLSWPADGFEAVSETPPAQP